MALPRPRASEPADSPPSGRQDETVDLAEQARICVGCRLCGSSHSRPVCSAEDLEAQRAWLASFYRRRWLVQNRAATEDRLSFTQNYATAIVACKECGLLYRNPRPRQQAIERAYRTDYYDDAYLRAEFEDQRTWFRSKIPVVTRNLPRIAARMAPRVLEIGSFVGGFLAEGMAAGWDVFGIDPGQDVVAFCRGQQLPVFQGTIEEARLAPASYDAIAVWNTFDQLPDPHALLRAAVPLLRDEGLLVVRVPNGACYEWAMSFRSHLPALLRGPLDAGLAWNNLLTFPYLYGYSAAQLIALTAPYGFRLRACLPDQLIPAPAGHLTWWARLEERTIKAMSRAGAYSWRDGASGRFRTAPWLDLYFERACAVDERTGPLAADLGLLPVYAPALLGQTDSKL